MVIFMVSQTDVSFYVSGTTAELQTRFVFLLNCILCTCKQIYSDATYVGYGRLDVAAFRMMMMISAGCNAEYIGDGRDTSEHNGVTRHLNLHCFCCCW